MNEPLRVTDRSQKYKVALFIVVVALLVVSYLDLRGLLTKSRELGGLAFPSRTTTSTVAVIGSSSTLVMATSTNIVHICNVGNNDAYLAFGLDVSTTSENLSRGMYFSTGTAATTCQGPFEFFGKLTGHTKTGVTTIQVTDFR